MPQEVTPRGWVECSLRSRRWSEHVVDETMARLSFESRDCISYYLFVIFEEEKRLCSKKSISLSKPCPQSCELLCLLNQYLDCFVL